MKSIKKKVILMALAMLMVLSTAAHASADGPPYNDFPTFESISLDFTDAYPQFPKDVSVYGKAVDLHIVNTGGTRIYFSLDGSLYGYSGYIEPGEEYIREGVLHSQYWSPNFHYDTFTLYMQCWHGGWGSCEATGTIEVVE